MIDQRTYINAQDDRFNLRTYVSRYLAYWWLYIICMAVLLSAALCYIWIKTPLYRIQASVVIKDEKKGDANSITIKELDFLDQQKIVDNEAEIIRSETVIRKAVMDLQLYVGTSRKKDIIRKERFPNDSLLRVTTLEMRPDSLPLRFLLTATDTSSFVINNASYRFGDTIAINGFVARIEKGRRTIPSYQPITIDVMAPGEVSEALRNGITITAPTKNSSVLHIAMLHADPAIGERILQAILENYRQNHIDEKQAQTDTIFRLIADRLALIGDQLQAYEGKAEDYKTGHGITNLSDDSRMFLERARLNDQKLAEASLQLEIIDALEQSVRASSSIVAPPQGSVTDPALLSMINRLSQMELEKEQLLRTTGERNPVIEIKKSQIESLRTAIMQNLSLQKTALKKTVTRLEEIKETLDKNLGAVPDNEKKLTEIIREKNIRESVYIYLLQKREEASLSNAAAFSKMRVIDPPYSTPQPVKPRKTIVLLIGFLSAILLATILINLKRALRNKVNGIADINKHLPGTYVGSTPRLKRFEYDVFAGAHSDAQRSFREVFTRLRRTMPPENKCAVTLIAAVREGAGRKFVALNLGILFSGVHRPTVVLAHSSELPALREIFNIGEHVYPFTALDAPHEPTLLSVAQHLHYPSLRLMLLPDEDQQNESMLQTIISTLKAQFTHILLVARPLTGYSDALEMATLADKTVFVLRQSHSTLAELEYLGRAFDRGDFQNASIVSNGA
jgi:tyrosine-protein kinase Etk/Wzc